MPSELLLYVVPIAIGYSLRESYLEAKERDNGLTFGKYFWHGLR
jgi:hypothetical protein